MLCKVSFETAENVCYFTHRKNEKWWKNFCKFRSQQSLEQKKDLESQQNQAKIDIDKLTKAILDKPAHNTHSKNASEWGQNVAQILVHGGFSAERIREALKQLPAIKKMPYAEQQEVIKQALHPISRQQDALLQQSVLAYFNTFLPAIQIWIGRLFSFRENETAFSLSASTLPVKLSSYSRKPLILTASLIEIRGQALELPPKIMRSLRRNIIHAIF